MSTKVVYPGTFDPVTFGHIDLIKRASKIFDQVIIGVAHTSGKNTLFSLKERVDMLKKITSNIKGLIIEPFEGLIVNYVHRKKARVVLRGLRMISDFEYEFQMALTNRQLYADIETIFMMPKPAYSYLSSKLIKEIALLGGDVEKFVPAAVARRLKKKFKNG